jgi:hypothetical protein
MTVLVACETVVLALLVLLVAGLLRSHAEILRRLGPPSAEDRHRAPDERQDPRLPSPARRATSTRQGNEIVGVTLEREPVKIGFGDGYPPTLLAFLTSGCTVCESFWSDLREGRRPPELPAEIRVVPVTKDPAHESPSRLRSLAPRGTQVVMSSAAWSDYGVPAAPYFVYLEGDSILGEGSANGWKQISSLVRDAIDDLEVARGGEARTRDIDRVLAASGIGPGHPSLYPAGQPARGAVSSTTGQNRPANGDGASDGGERP